jgi:thymidylate synthase
MYLYLQFLLRGGLRNLVVYMRSNEAYKGLAHDIFAFTMLQEIMAREIGADVGTYSIWLAAYIYMKIDLQRVDHFLTEGYQSTHLLCRQCL